MPRQRGEPTKTFGVRLPESVLPTLTDRAEKSGRKPTGYLTQLVVAALAAPERLLPAGAPRASSSQQSGCVDGKHDASRRIGKGCGACGDEKAWSK